MRSYKIIGWWCIFPEVNQPSLQTSIWNWITDHIQANCEGQADEGLHCDGQGQAMNTDHVDPYRDRVLLHSWNFTHWHNLLYSVAGGKLRAVQLMFKTIYAMVKKEHVTDAAEGRNGVQLFNENMAQFSSPQCFKSTLVYIIMCITEERAPYSPTYLTDG